MKTYLVTRNSCRKANSCYSDEELAELIPLEGLTPQQVAGLVSVSAEDRHWALAHASSATDRILQEHICWCARQLLARVENPDPRSIQAVEVSERFARGEATDEELDAALVNAEGAAYNRPWATCLECDAAWLAYTTTWLVPDAIRAVVKTWHSKVVSIMEAQVKDLASRLMGKE
jgi:hypothetical protein